MVDASLKKHWPLWTLLVVAAAATTWSAIAPHDYPTWFFEIMLGLQGVIVLAAIYRRFRFSSVIYVVCAVHYLVLAVGAKHTYALEPVFAWLKEALGLSRNHFDRVGHFMQGFTPALLTREILIRKSPLKPGKWLTFVSISVPLALSAFYELIEMWCVLAFCSEPGGEWLGHQGDVWDAQWDMTMALLGAVLALLLLSRLQDRTMKAVWRQTGSK